ncbi:MAG: hypothetical protein ACTSUE_16300 [Promethearchaeota archaeon]
MADEKICAGCGQVLKILTETVYCFTCDALYCDSCMNGKIAIDGGKWTCPGCNSIKGIEESKLFKHE